MLKAKVNIIDFGFARHLKAGDLAYSIIGSPIYMDPGILRKLNKMENSRNYGYDQKADIWSLGTICYEMLIGKCTFDAQSMRELLSKVESGNYFLPKTLSKEVVSFLNGMLQYDLKKRLSSEQLLNHKFLTKPYSELTRINLKEASKYIVGSNIRINSKNNQSIWAIIETEEENIDDISSEMFEMPKQTQNKDDINHFIIDEEVKIFINKDVIVDKGIIDEKSIKKEFLEAFESMNDDFIYIEPKLIPIVPGDDPSVINKVSEFNEDTF